MKLSENPYNVNGNWMKPLISEPAFRILAKP